MERELWPRLYLEPDKHNVESRDSMVEISEESLIHY